MTPFQEGDSLEVLQVQEVKRCMIDELYGSRFVKANNRRAQVAKLVKKSAALAEKPEKTSMDGAT